MTLLRSVIFLFMVSLSGVSFSAVDTSDPSVMLKQISTQALERIKNNPAILTAETSELRAIVDQDLLPYVDYKYAAFKVMGPAVKTSTPEQRENFAEVFKEYMANMLTLLFKQYEPERHLLQFDPVRIPGQIPARFISPGKPDISVIFYVRQNSKTQEWKVWDIAAQGISQVETKYKEFLPLIRQHGIDYVTTELQNKIQKGLSDEELPGVTSND